jgi:HEPN domain-containing protein
MKRRETELRALVGEWVRKAEQDLAGAECLASAGSGLRELVAFHAQQAAEKYLKALLVWYQIEFPKTHDIEKLLYLVRIVEPQIADSVAEAAWLTPFGVETRYPSDFPQTLAGDEQRAVELAGRVREAVMTVLNLAGL